MQQMKDAQIRGIVLERFYDARHKVDWVDFAALRTHVTVNETQLANICRQLGEHGLIEWAIRGHFDWKHSVTRSNYCARNRCD